MIDFKDLIKNIEADAREAIKNGDLPEHPTAEQIQEYTLKKMGLTK